MDAYGVGCNSGVNPESTANELLTIGAKQLCGLIAKVAPTDATVLIVGESGTGKELVARALHEQSLRRGGPFIAVNVAAVPRDLVESLLFGHVQGAFTGATRGAVGCCRAAHGGTLFLDEVAEADLQLQTKLLRFLQERIVQPVGSTDCCPVDVRIIAATNRDPMIAIQNGQFRQDLFYRLNVVTICTSPLRERREEIPALARYFLQTTAVAPVRPVGFTAEAMACLLSYDWPGNVRQLRSAIERAAIFAEGELVEVRDLPPEITHGSPDSEIACSAKEPNTLDQWEHKLIRWSLRQSLGCVKQAAQQMGVSTATMYRKVKAYGINLDAYRRPNSIGTTDDASAPRFDPDPAV